MGKRKDGIKTVNDIKLRCYVDENHCWHWRMTTAGVRSAPRAWFPKLEISTSVTSILSYLAGIDRGMALRPVCGTLRCCNPKHMRPFTYAEISSEAHKARNPAWRLKLIASKSNGSKLSDQQVLEIRSSKEPSSVLAKRYGIHASYARGIRAGSYRRPIVSSVFNQ